MKSEWVIPVFLLGFGCGVILMGIAALLEMALS